MGELRDLARGSAQHLSYASAGVGTTGHVLGALISQVFGVELEHVPYRGTGPAVTDVLAGRVQILTNAAAPLRPHIASGGLRALAVAAPRRLALLPEVPTTVEQGFPDIISSTWYGLLAPAGTPADRIACATCRAERDPCGREREAPTGRGGRGDRAQRAAGRLRPFHRGGPPTLAAGGHAREHPRRMSPHRLIPRKPLRRIAGVPLPRPLNGAAQHA